MLTWFDIYHNNHPFTIYNMYNMIPEKRIGLSLLFPFCIHFVSLLHPLSISCPSHVALLGASVPRSYHAPKYKFTRKSYDPWMYLFHLNALDSWHSNFYPLHLLLFSFFQQFVIRYKHWYLKGLENNVISLVLDP